MQGNARQDNTIYNIIQYKHNNALRTCIFLRGRFDAQNKLSLIQCSITRNTVQDNTRQYNVYTIQYKTHTPIQCNVIQDQIIPGTTRKDTTSPDQSRPDQTRQDKTRPDKTRQGKTRQDKTGQDKTRQDIMV